jgi:hypothetical protein
MKTINVSEATNTQLDWLVAEAELEREQHENCSRYIDHKGRVMWERGDLSWGFTPTTDWALMGPIIEREGMALCLDRDRVFSLDEMVERWYAVLPMICEAVYLEYGSTPLIAACRCYVVAKLDDTVEVPEELS